MTTRNPDEHVDESAAGGFSRREFVTTTMAAGIAMAAGSASAQGLPVTEAAVTIQTGDGSCDAAFIHPTTGTHPAVIIWTDAFGLRPSFREMGKRLASSGYAVLIPNPFYRLAKAPVNCAAQGPWV